MFVTTKIMEQLKSKAFRKFYVTVTCFMNDCKLGCLLLIGQNKHQSREENYFFPVV